MAPLEEEAGRGGGEVEGPGGSDAMAAEGAAWEMGILAAALQGVRPTRRRCRARRRHGRGEGGSRRKRARCRGDGGPGALLGEGVAWGSGRSRHGGKGRAAADLKVAHEEGEGGGARPGMERRSVGRACRQ